MIWSWEWPSVCTLFLFKLFNHLLFQQTLVRYAYMVMNYGDFIVGSTNQTNPYMQFLSVTDPAQGIYILLHHSGLNAYDVFPAHTDFVKVRLNGVDTTMNDSLLNHGHSGLSSRLIGLIVALTLIVSILVAVISFVIYRRRRNQTRRFDNAGSPLSAYPSSPKKEGFGLLTPSQSRIPRDSYDDPFQRRPNIPSYTPNSFSQHHHPRQPPRKKR